jgi:hypothetical protein
MVDESNFFLTKAKFVTLSYQIVENGRLKNETCHGGLVSSVHSAIGFFLIIPTTVRGFHILSSAGLFIHYWYLILSVAFLCEYVDSTLGIAYGTTLTPILLTMGFEPLQVVPCILLSELITGVMAGFFHHEFGNVDFSRGSDHAKVALSLATCSIVGSLIAVIIAIRLPSWALKIYMSLLVLTMGCVILMTLNKKYIFS